MAPTGGSARIADGHIPSKRPDKSRNLLFYNDSSLGARCLIRIRLSGFQFYGKEVIWLTPHPHDHLEMTARNQISYQSH